MTFEEWKKTRLPLAHYGKATLVREAWEAATKAESERLMLGEFICVKCGLRKNIDHEPSVDF